MVLYLLDIIKYLIERFVTSLLNVPSNSLSLIIEILLSLP